MGLIKAVLGSVTSTLSDTYKDYFVCDALDSDTLIARGVKRGGKGNDEVITNGSKIIVNEGQCALIVDEGVVLEVANEVGAYTFDSTTSPSIFDGGWSGLKETAKVMWEKFTFGGEEIRNQHIYYINTKEIFGNKFGTTTPIPFRLIDKNIGLDVELPIRCNGEYSFKIANPILFYQNVSGNVTSFDKEELVAKMKSEMLDALNPAFSKIAALGVRYSEVPAHKDDLVAALNEALNAKWTEKRGIVFADVSINSITTTEEMEKKISDLQFAAVNRDLSMAAATNQASINQSRVDAANNPNGAVNGFFAAGMAGGNNADSSTLYAMAGSQKQATPVVDTWTCECGSVNDGAFCPKCGKAKPAGGFCPKCGKPVSGDAAFCPSCGAKL